MYMYVKYIFYVVGNNRAAGLPDNVATYSVVSGLWSSVLALGLFIGPSIAGLLYDTVGFRWGSLFVVGASALLVCIKL
jgi:MFS family permease